MAKAEYKPSPDPSWVKGTMVEDYIGIAHRNGADPSSSDIERLVQADLELTDAVERNAKPAPSAKKPEPTSAVGQGVKDLAAQSGMVVGKRKLTDKRKPSKSFLSFMDRPPQNPKQAAAIMRLGQILKPASWFRPSQEVDYVLPALAQSFTETLAELHRGRGEFAGKSAVDCERIVWRRIEDLCDRSTGRLGPWWVK